MTEFVFIRHGEPNYEIVNDWAKIDVAKNFGPLTENGVMQIENATKQLLGEGNCFDTCDGNYIYIRANERPGLRRNRQSKI